MAYENDVLTRNDNDELAVRTVQTTGDNPGAYDDIYTRDNNGKLCVRVTGAGGGGGSDPHNLGWYATQSALETAHPTAEDGDWAIVGSTDTVWVWDSDNNEWKDTDQKGQVESVNGQTGTVVLTASDVGAATTAQGAKADTAVQPGDLATVATTGSYTDLTNTPTIPAAQVNSDWNSTSGVSEILNKPTLATVATSGSYDDLTDKPTIPAAQVNSDWNAASGVAQILNKPTLGTMASESASDYTPTSGLATVATTGSYSDLSGTPTIPTVGDGTITITQGGVTKGTFTTNQSGNTTIDVDAGGGSLPSQTGNAGKFLTTDGTDASWSDKPLVNIGTASNSLIISRGRSSSNKTNAVSINASDEANSSVAVGGESQTVQPYGLALGCGANSLDVYSIQLGRGDNAEAKTFFVGLDYGKNYKLLDSDGTIPTARLTKVNTTVTLAAAGWSSNTQTVNVTGMTADGVVMVSPDPTDQSAYTSAGILCTAQAAGTLTFTATTTPTNDIDVNIVCL